MLGKERVHQYQDFKNLFSRLFCIHQVLLLLYFINSMMHIFLHFNISEIGIYLTTLTGSIFISFSVMHKLMVHLTINMGCNEIS